MKLFVHRLTNIIHPLGQLFQKCFIAWTKPAKSSLIMGAVGDLSKSKAELITEKALLRQQLIVLNRQIKKPSFTALDRFFLVILVYKLANWKQALLRVYPKNKRSDPGIK